MGEHARHRRNADSGAGEHHVAKRCGEYHLVSDGHGVVDEVWHLAVCRAGSPDAFDGELPVQSVVGFGEAYWRG
jgi:hypothetical protein